ncbi:hypothetical protein NDU88_003978 [Pleurodeles waltl]|uniref:Uncharacterized protein n=1 Tax=Pleurodeles waltl TaxID=8319 RepID=A0AAV7M4Z2_PLEWA|nr:hypothetical protein NDU88_003978 [Pleurodeles waltl]
MPLTEPVLKSLGRERAGRGELINRGGNKSSTRPLLLAHTEAGRAGARLRSRETRAGTAEPGRRRRNPGRDRGAARRSKQETRKACARPRRQQPQPSPFFRDSGCLQRRTRRQHLEVRGGSCWHCSKGLGKNGWTCSLHRCPQQRIL